MKAPLVFVYVNEGLEEIGARNTTLKKELVDARARVEALEQRHKETMQAEVAKEAELREARKAREGATAERVPHTDILHRWLAPPTLSKYQRAATEHRSALATHAVTPVVQRQPAVQIAPVLPHQHPCRDLPHGERRSFI